MIEVKATPENLFWGYFDADTPPVAEINSGETVMLHTLTACFPEDLPPDSSLVTDDHKAAMEALTPGGDGSKVVGLTYKDRTTDELKQVDVAGIFVQIGLVPNTEWLKGGDLNLTRFGEIEIDSRGSTNLEGVFAAGDVTTVPFKQIIIAMGAGSTAALAAFDHLIRTPDPAAAKKEEAKLA